MSACAHLPLRLRLRRPSLFLCKPRLPELRHPFIASVLLSPILCSSDVCLVGLRGLWCGHFTSIDEPEISVLALACETSQLLLDSDDLLSLFSSFGGRDSSIPFQSQRPQSSSPNADSFRLSEVLLHRFCSVCCELSPSILQPGFAQHAGYMGITRSFRQS